MIVIHSLCICMNKKSWKWPGNESCFLTIHPCINTISLGRINIIWFWHLFHWCGKFTYFECFHTGSIEILTFGSWMYKTDSLYKPSIFLWFFFLFCMKIVRYVYSVIHSNYWSILESISTEFYDIGWAF